MGRLWVVVLLALGLASSSGAHAQAAYDWRTDVVQTVSGMVGAARDSVADMRIFKAIPFAAPPTGPLRWQAPQPPAAWEGVRRSETSSPACMQPPRSLRALF